MNEIVTALEEDRAVAVIRASSIAAPSELAEALVLGGIRSVEFTFTTPSLERIIAEAAGQARGAVIGAGTVLTGLQANLAIDAGARFLVTPGLVAEVAKVAVSRNIPIILGAMTPSEVIQALDLGATAVKIFPASTVGPGHVAAILAALPGTKLLASGGIDGTNVRSFIEAGAFAVAAGSSVVPSTALATGDWHDIRQRAAQFRAAAHGEARD